LQALEDIGSAVLFETVTAQALFHQSGDGSTQSLTPLPGQALRLLKKRLGQRQCRAPGSRTCWLSPRSVGPRR
jgi:hypothetical protein